jgi:hypothetical protein
MEHCDDCNFKKSIFREIFNKHLCSNCYKQDKYKLICKRVVLSKYLLKDDEINHIPNILKRNIHRGVSILYSEEDIKKAFSEKFKNILKQDVIITDEVVDEINEYFKHQKMLKKQSTLEHLLEKEKISIVDIPDHLIKNFLNNKSCSKIEILEHCKKLELIKHVSKYNLERYLDYELHLKYYTEELNLQEIIDFIYIKQHKMKLMDEEFAKHNIDRDKYIELYYLFVNNKTHLSLDEIINKINTQYNLPIYDSDDDY